MPQIAETEKEIECCFEVMSQLRPHLRREDFLSQVRQMAAEGYRLAFVREDAKVVAVAGYRISTSFHMGRHLYVNDLVTAEYARSRGHGERLLAWLREQAVAAGCRYFDLDSGTQRCRAHKFYFAHGFTIASFHFSEALGEDG